MGDTTFTAREIAEVVLNIKDLAHKQGYKQGQIWGLSAALNIVKKYYTSSEESYWGSNDLTRPLEEIIEYLETKKEELTPSPPG